MKILALPLAVLCIASTSASAQWNPNEGWKDSYAVNGVCYCDSSNYDHNLDEKSADTPIGRLNVVRICEDIKAAIGSGSTNGRIPYNDIQCGNGPANDAADEAGCPGRVDIGSAGCNVIGPKWDLEAVYGDGDPDDDDDNNPTNTSGTTASPNGGDSRFAIDGNTNTRWTTKTAQRPGQVFQLDLGSSQTIGKVILDSRNSSNDEPAGYSLSTSTNGSSYSVVATGSGSSNGLTEINFSERSARYVRITQTGSKSRNWWSIHEISVARAGDDDDTDETDNGGDTLDRGDWVLVASRNNGDANNAIDSSDSSRWTTRQRQRDGQWFEIDLSETQSFNKIVLDSEDSSNDYPRNYRLSVSNNGSNWTTVTSGAGSSTTTMTFNRQTARYIRIEQTGSDNRYWWSIHDVNVYR